MICLHCDEPIQPGEEWHPINDGTAFEHKECLVRSVIGSVGHQQGRCSCFGVEDVSEEGMTRREAAIAAYHFFLEHRQENPPREGLSDRFGSV